MAPLSRSVLSVVGVSSLLLLAVFQGCALEYRGSGDVLMTTPINMTGRGFETRGVPDDVKVPTRL